MTLRSELESVEVVEVVRVVSRRGKGIEEDPIRLVTSYWAFDGRKLAEDDPIDRITSPPKQISRSR